MFLHKQTKIISGSLGSVYTRRGLQGLARVMVRVPLFLLQSPSAFKIKKEKKRNIYANTEQKMYAAMFFAWLSPSPFPFKGIISFPKRHASGERQIWPKPLF